jgi:tetratricopeptide (TPR) repeat protein
MKPHQKRGIGFRAGELDRKPEGMKTPRKKRMGFETGVPAEKEGETKTYRDEKLGFEIEIPEDWSLASGQPLLPAISFALKSGWIPRVDVQFCGSNEALNIVIEPMMPEPPPDVTELLFTLQAQDMEYANCEFGRITIGGKEHTWARYQFADKAWSKKYMIVLGGKGYAITVSCNDQGMFAQREKVWDAIASSFCLLAPIDDSIIDLNKSLGAHRTIAQLRETLETRIERRARSLSYGRACEAIEDNRYSDARVWLEKCLSEFSEGNIDTQVFILGKLVYVLEKLGDKKGILGYRKEMKRLNPSNYANRLDLVELLAGCGYRKEALREVEELIALEPDNSAFKKLKTSLVSNTRPNYRLRFVLSVAYFLFVNVDVLAGGITLIAPWLAAFLCLPAANYLNLSGRWVGLTRKTSDWITMALFLSTLVILVLKGGLDILFSVFIFPFVFFILKDNALRD